MAIGHDQEVELQPVESGRFVVVGRYPMTIRFTENGELILNEGRWEQRAPRLR